MAEGDEYKNLKEFYPYYKHEHSKAGTRVLHMIGTSLFLAQAAAAAHTRDARLLLSGIVSAYGFAWVGHFFIEKNKPATFRYPFLSLIRWAADIVAMDRQTSLLQGQRAVDRAAEEYWLHGVLPPMQLCWQMLPIRGPQATTTCHCCGLLLQ